MKSVLFFLSIIFLVVACQPDNFDEITTETLPFEPIVLEEGSKIKYRFKEKETVHEQGYGVVVNSFDTKDYYLSSDTITLCEVNQSEGGLGDTSNVIGRFSEFYITFSTDENGEVYAPSGYIVETLGDNNRVNYYGGFPFTPECSTNTPITLNIEEKTDDFISGTFEAEFFQSVVDSLIPPVPDNCDDWESVGVMKAAFAVPLTVCE